MKVFGREPTGLLWLPIGITFGSPQPLLLAAWKGFLQLTAEPGSRYQS
ncbi:hypothetical protein GCM10009525_21740 [Streptosporangium amethystogenes subsp. fukuiense]